MVPSVLHHLLLLLLLLLPPLLLYAVMLTPILMRKKKKKKKELAELSSAYFTCREYNSGATTACYLPVFLGSTNSRKLSFTLGKYPSTRMHTPHVTARLNSRGARALLLYLFPDSSVLFLPIGFQFQNTFDTTSRKTGRSPYRSTTTEK